MYILHINIKLPRNLSIQRRESHGTIGALNVAIRGILSEHTNAHSFVFTLVPVKS